MERVLVTGAGGFIGHHLVDLPQGARATGSAASTSSSPSTPPIDADEFELLDLRRPRSGCSRPRAASTRSTRWRPTWAAWASSRPTTPTILHNNVADQPAHARGRPRSTASSATSTPRRPASTPSTSRPTPTSTPLKEEDAYPAAAAGRLRLGEADHRACCAATTPTSTASRPASSASTTSTARYGTYDGGREKAPAAMCRKVAAGRADGGSIEIWGDGEQTRSFCYIDDCVEGIYRLMRPTTASRSTSAPDRMVTHQRAGRSSSRRRRQDRDRARPHRRARRACAAATRTTPGCARCSAGSRRSTSRRASPDLPLDRGAGPRPRRRPRPRRLKPSVSTQTTGLVTRPVA